MDLSAITLMQIKETVQRIEGKLDQMLEAPLKNAKKHFDSAIKRMSYKRTKDAYDLFDKVIDQATNAYNLLDNKDVSIVNFEGGIQAIQLLIFSEIARISYDEKRECFLPISLLKKSDISLLGNVLEEYVEGCIKKKENVKTSTWYSKTKELQNEAKVQNIVDTILNISYPYISESKGWTNMWTKITSFVPTVSITAMPQYLPMGAEDKTRVAVGVLTDKNEVLHMNIWRTEDMVFASAPFAQGHKIQSITGLMTIKISLTGVVLSSTGGAAQHQGGSLGQYCHDTDMGCYVQTNTEEGHERYKPQYIYPVDNGWYVGSTLGEKKGLFLENPTRSQTVPTTEWNYYGGKSWVSDPTLVISAGPLTSLCNILTVSASGPAAEKQSDKMGEFSRTERWFNGKPVFRNSQGRLLHQSPTQGWHVGRELGEAGLRGSMAHHCPSQERKWTYWDGSKRQPASVKIDCKVHG